MNKSLASGLAVGFTAVAALMYAVSPRVTERDAALKIVRGALVDSTVTPGLKFDDILPHVQYIKLPKFLQKMQVDATKASDITIRTKEDARIYGVFEVHYAIDNGDPNFGKIYTDLKADEMKDIEPFIRNYTIPAAIAVYKDIEATAVSSNLTETGRKIAENLQKILSDRGYTYIVVKDVVPSGVGLSERANQDLEQIVSENRKLNLLAVQKQVAEQSVAVTEKQVDVTAKALKGLKEAGVPDGQLVQAYYLQLLRDGDKLGKPFVPGPIPGTGVGAVPVEQVAAAPPTVH